MPVDSTLRPLSRRRVLIVSAGLYAATLAQALQGDGHFDVVQAGSDYEASAQMARFEPDAVVLDMTSATLDCLALCRWVCTSLEGQQVAVLAVGDPEDEETARAAGADVYLPGIAIADRLDAELEALLELK